MIATNHAVTGAVIGLSIGNAWLAVPLALASHFALDALPHFGFSNLNERGQRFTRLLLADTTLCGLLVAFLFLAQPQHWLLASGAALAAASPDFMWAPDYFRTRHGHKENNLNNPIKAFHSRIQWYQRPPGAVVELVYAGLLVTILVNLV